MVDDTEHADALVAEQGGKMTLAGRPPRASADHEAVMGIASARPSSTCVQAGSIGGAIDPATGRPTMLAGRR